MPRDYEKYKSYYQSLGRAYYRRDRDKILKNMRERRRNDPEYREKLRQEAENYRRNNPEKVKASLKKHFTKIRNSWGYTNKNIAKKAEILAVTKILPSLGFENTLYLPELNCGMMFYDVLCEKDGVKYGVQVRTGILSSLKKKQRQVADFFGIVYVVLFVKPTLDYFRLMKPNSKNYSAIVSNQKNLVCEGSVEKP